MAMDWTKIYKKYKGLWVAVRDDKTTTVVGSGRTLKEAVEEAREKGCEKPILHKVPSELIPYVGSFSG